MVDKARVLEALKYQKLRRWRPDYWAADHSEGIHEHFYNLNPASVLDVGCGNGKFCEWASREGVGLVIGADVALPDGLLNPGILWLDAFAQDIPLPDRCVEWVTSFDVLEHIPRGDVDVALGELHRINRKGMILSISHREDKKRWISETLHVTVEPRDWWISKIKALGYQVGVLDYIATTRSGLKAPHDYLICKRSPE